MLILISRKNHSVSFRNTERVIKKIRERREIKKVKWINKKEQEQIYY